MLRTLLAASAALAFAGPALAGLLPDAGTVGNKFIVHYSFIPDPFHLFSWYTMPRTVAEAQVKNEFSQVAVRDEDKTTLWCRGDDYRVCVFFDQKGSVAGIKMSVKVSELEDAEVRAPVNIGNIPEYVRETLLGQEVYSASTFFVSKDVLLSGGRDMTKDTLTAPDGIYILQSDKSGVETNRLHVKTEQAAATSVGFTEQACFFGMGKHFFQELTKTSTCEAHRPYFLLYGPQTGKLNGFGYTQYGKVSKGRGWFENPPAVAAVTIAPDSPPCMKAWIDQYGLYTMHVFFVDTPWATQC